MILELMNNCIVAKVINNLEKSMLFGIILNKIRSLLIPT